MELVRGFFTLGFMGSCVVWIYSLLRYGSRFSEIMVKRAWYYFFIYILGVGGPFLQLLYIPMSWVDTGPELVLILTLDLPVFFSCIWLSLYYFVLREGTDVAFFCIHGSQNLVKNRRLLYRIMAMAGALLVGVPVGIWLLMLYTILFS